MAGLGSKTPVSRLQEYLASNKVFPHYELIHNGVGTQNPFFTYRVQTGLLWEEATGRSKREAKHRAAEKMLRSLNVIESAEEENMGEFNLEPGENSVGQLKELCRTQCYPEPRYYLEESGGPPHCRIFRMLCCVSQLRDYGISSTKKQAKQEAASKMLQRLKELKSNKTNTSLHKTEVSLEENKGTEIKTALLDTTEIMEKYNSLRPSAAPVVKDPTVFYKDHHKAYVGLQATSPTLLKIINDITKVSAEGSLSLISDIAQELEVTLTTSEIPSDEDKSFIIIAMSVFPPVAGLGNTEQNAALNLLNSLMFLCKENLTVSFM